MASTAVIRLAGECVSGPQVSEDAIVFARKTSYTLSGGKVASINLAVRNFVRDEEGAALAEYGILVAFIAIVAITAVTFFGSKISAKFSSLANSFT